MKFKLSLIYTALFAGVSVSVLAETQHKASTETIEQINVQDTGIKQNGYQTTGTSVVSKAEVPVFVHAKHSKYSFDQTTRRS